MVETGLAKREPTAPPLPRWNRSQIDLLKRTVAKGLTDDEMQLFVYVCRRTGLDPFLRQAYAIKRWDSEDGDYRMAIQTGIDGYRLQAARSESYAGSDPPEFEVDSENQPVMARVTVYKIVGGERCAFTGEARWSEYVQRTKEGQPTRMWRTSPFNQLAKCAEAQALRKGFPAEVQGINIHEEMPAIEGGGDEAGAGTFSAATLYEGKVTLFRLPDPKRKRPGQIAVSVDGQGVLGPLGFWDIPEVLKDIKPDDAMGLHVQISYAEVTGKKGTTYKNLSHLAVKPPEAGGEEEPGQEAGGESPPAQGGQSPHTEQQAGPSDPAVDGARQPLGGEPPVESAFTYWMRMIRESKTLTGLEAWWVPFGRKDGKLWEFTPEQRGKIVAAKEARKKELSGK